MSDPADLSAFLNHAWQRLSHGVADATSDARYVGFATVSPDGWPEARTVALRAARRDESVVEVHTDAATAKIAALQADPRAQLLIWDEPPRLQIRLFAEVEILSRDDAAADWARVPHGSRVSYGKEPEPGQPIDDPHAYRVTSDRAAFRVLRCHLRRIDLVELGDIHRRAEYHVTDNWSGQWLSP